MVQGDRALEFKIKNLGFNDENKILKFSVACYLAIANTFFFPKGRGKMSYFQ